MKILDVSKIREADSYTIQNEPISSIDLMERAGYNCSKWIAKKLQKEQKVYIFVGPGNNGGDGLVIGRLLAKKGYSVHITLLYITEFFSDDFTANWDRIKQMDKVAWVEAKSRDDFPIMETDSLIIDSIFGSGLSRPVDGLVFEAIQYINQNQAVTVAIDIPSGLYADALSDEKNGAIIHADYTLSLQMAKYSFLFSENEFFVGSLQIIPIGLHPEFLKNVEPRAFLLDLVEVRSIWRSRAKFSHKGTFGHGLLIAGSYGKIGASVLASKAALRAGIGLLSTHTPQCGVNILQTSVPEAMVSIDKADSIFSQLPNLAPYNAIGIGPSLGVDERSQKALKLLIQEFKGPIVFDADALNILSENLTWISFIHPGSIFTPHPKEFERLVGKSNNSFERVQKQVEFSMKNKVVVVLKGAYTSITSPNGALFFNSSGNPGMATAGSGDVLTGIILGLLAQAYQPLEAALLGVFIHGLAGDKAAAKKSTEAMIASDIIDNLGKAFLEIQKS